MWHHAFLCWVAALIAGMFAGAASFPPRELMFVMAPLAATAIPGDASQALERAAVTAAGVMQATSARLPPRQTKALDA